MRMFISLLIAFLLTGLARLIISLVMVEELDWVLIFFVGAIAGILAFLVSSWRERGPLYAVVVVLVVTLAAGLVSAIRNVGFLRNSLSMLTLQALYGGLMILGDRLGRGSRVLRLVFGASGGLVAGVLVTAGLALYYSTRGGFAGFFIEALPQYLLIPVGSAVGLYLSRVLLGEKSKTVKESAE